ncbi:MAG TPA: hypothetical protein VFA27_09775 [Vicinamibacterales bacterium]|nr:hypothetical protein [Vicinamibacterales bacterium]
MTELSWRWIAGMAIVPLPLGVLLAIPIWRRKEMILGNVAGTMVIFGCAFALIFRESAMLDLLRRQCFASGEIICWPTPSAFARYAIYAGLGIVEVLVLFMVSLNVERRIRERDYAPEWRR